MSDQNGPDPLRTAGAATAQAVLQDHVDGLTDAEARQASLLPGWSIGHVLTHLARNAEGMLRMIDAAANGEVGVMYPGGMEGRAADIETGAFRPAAELLADVRRTGSQLIARWDALDADAWRGAGRTVFAEIPITDVPFMRWREVTVHHADLGPVGGRTYSWTDWPDDFVAIELPRALQQWASRRPPDSQELPPAVRAVPERHRVAWLLDRAEIDGLPRVDQV